MEWLRAHPYLFVVAVVAILIVGGAIFVESRSPVVPESSSGTWGSGTPISAYQNQAPAESPQQIVAEMTQGGVAENVTIPALAASGSSAIVPTANSIDYVSLLAELSGQSGVTASASSSASGQAAISEAYEFIPTGLIATTAPAKKPLSADQQALYEYGNEIGGEIESFEELHTNEAEVIKDQAEDRTDPTKAAAVVSLGQGFVSVGTFMQGMQNVPSDVETQHTALAQSYVDLGTQLQAVAQTQTDAAFVQAVEKYDTTADTFVKNYGSMAAYFTEQGVSFAPQDPGSVFSFTDSGGGGL